MKKLILFTVVTLTILSCKKQHTCRCETKSTKVIDGTTYITTGYTNVVTEKETKKKFRKKYNCYSTNSNTSEINSSETSQTTTEIVCTLK